MLFNSGNIYEHFLNGTPNPFHAQQIEKVFNCEVKLQSELFTVIKKLSHEPLSTKTRVMNFHHLSFKCDAFPLL